MHWLSNMLYTFKMSLSNQNVRGKLKGLKSPGFTQQKKMSEGDKALPSAKSNVQPLQL